MALLAFLSAVMVLLIAPGPTNTLMGLAGAQKGLGHVARLIPAELAGYLTAILPLSYLGAQALAQSPTLALILQGAAALWVMYLALKLWNLTAVDSSANEVSAGRIYLTTMLNPKALIFGLVLLPAPSEPDYLTRLALFCVMVSGVALLWGSAGTLTQAGPNSGKRLHLVQRVASVWLGFVSVSLFVRIISA